MGDLLDRAAEWLVKQRHQHLTRAVTYRRGATAIEVQATVGRTVFRLDDAYGAVVRHVSRDYLIRADDLVIDGETVTPKRGDRIEEVVGDSTITHEVMGPGRNEPDWRFSDSQRMTLRIHTKQIGADTP